MQIREITLEYARTVSDGNYGSERVGLQLTATLPPEQRTAHFVEALGDLARLLVTEQLRLAATPGVRRAVRAEELDSRGASQEGR